MWDGRIKLVREKGLAAIVDANMERWFTKGFRERSPQAVARIRDMFLATNVDGYIGCGEAIRAMDHRPLLPKINAPTLVIAGRHDPATTLEAGEFIAQHIPDAKLAVLDAAHIANMEQPKVYADTVLGVFAENCSPRCERSEAIRDRPRGLRFRSRIASLPRDDDNDHPPVIAKFVRRRAGMLAEEAGEVRRVGKRELLRRCPGSAGW